MTQKEKDKINELIQQANDEKDYLKQCFEHPQVHIGETEEFASKLADTLKTLRIIYGITL